MTPDQARELLRGDFASDAHQTSVGNLEAGTVSTGTYIYGTPGDFALTEAAPALAQTVANLHCEYAVRTSRDGKSGYVYMSSWCRSYDEAADRAVEVKRVNPHTTIVRRLVSDPEVVE